MKCQAELPPDLTDASALEGNLRGSHVQFTLHYRGDLKANARPPDKHELRRHFHRQLAECWRQAPLRVFEYLLKPPNPAAGKTLSLLTDLHGFTFAPLISQRIHLVAELDIQVLWPQEPGAIITSGGDIDNRLKTLLDAFKMPSEPTALPPGASPHSDENPFFCLLEDDSLVTRLAVDTDRLLEPVTSLSEVELWIRVRTRQLVVLMDTIGLA